MNATESMTEAYFRIVRKCLTSSDVKVVGSFGRQFDLLATCPRTGEQFHIEVSVKHGGFNSNLEQLMKKVDKKFFGAPKKIDQRNCLEVIKKTYADLGFDFLSVTRVWVPWVIKGSDDPTMQAAEAYARLARQYGIKKPKFEVILFRDHMLPTLLAAVGTANFDDPIVRTLSLIVEYQRQSQIISEGNAARTAIKNRDRAAA